MVNGKFFALIYHLPFTTYWVQTLADSVLLEEMPLIVTDAGTLSTMQAAEEVSETVN